ncbi:hypothetical protein GCM10009662_44010 [Catellatospora coxensis]
MTLSGDAVGQVKDVVYGPTGGPLRGFTLAGRGMFAGPRDTALPADAVHAIGPDAVMIESEDRLTESGAVVDEVDARDRAVLDDKVVTDTGTELGTVCDVILRLDGVPQVVGYEIRANPVLQARGHRVLIPVPDVLPVSGQAVVVPQEVVAYACADLDRFDAAVDAFRQRRRSHGDIVIRGLAEGLDPTHARLSEVVSADCVTVRPGPERRRCRRPDASACAAPPARRRGRTTGRRSVDRRPGCRTRPGLGASRHQQRTAEPVTAQVASGDSAVPRARTAMAVRR